MNYRIVLQTLLFTLVMAACVSPYTPDISKYDNILVVDGEITNLSGPYTVYLSRSYSYSAKTSDPVCGAMVKIIDNEGLEIALSEISDGTYSTQNNSFTGVVGNSYKVQIVIDGSTYESAFETIKVPIPIDRVYWEYITKDDEDGIQLFVDAHDPNNKTHFYGWDYNETWKFKVPYFNPIKHPDWEVCYKSNENLKFNIASTAKRNNDVVERQPLCFIGEGTNRLYFRYSILVKQYSLGDQSYKFFKDLSTQNYSQGTLFDPIPGSLEGNLKNISDPTIPVLGYFLVCGASEKRIFIDRKELPDGYSPTDGFDCTLHTYSVVDTFPNNNYRLNHHIDSLMTIGYRIFYDQKFTEREDKLDTIWLYLAKPFCSNCTLNGTNMVPDFWVEDKTSLK